MNNKINLLLKICKDQEELYDFEIVSQIIKSLNEKDYQEVFYYQNFLFINIIGFLNLLKEDRKKECLELIPQYKSLSVLEFQSKKFFISDNLKNIILKTHYKYNGELFPLSKEEQQIFVEYVASIGLSVSYDTFNYIENDILLKNEKLLTKDNIRQYFELYKNWGKNSFDENLSFLKIFCQNNLTSFSKIINILSQEEKEIFYKDFNLKNFKNFLKKENINKLVSITIDVFNYKNITKEDLTIEEKEIIDKLYKLVLANNQYSQSEKNYRILRNLTDVSEDLIKRNERLVFGLTNNSLSKVEEEIKTKKKYEKLMNNLEIKKENTNKI